MIEMVNEYDVTSNVDMPRPFTPRKAELPRKMVNIQSDFQRSLVF